MLYKHQLDGAAWLASRSTGRGYLGDEPGLGKTRTVIEALHRSNTLRPLIVCPAIVRTHWHREHTAWSLGLDMTVKSYDEIVRGGNELMVKLIRDEKIDALVLDEAHYLKHATSQRALQLLGKDGYARRLPFVFPASGTPMPRNPLELWTIMGSLFPEVAIAHGIKTQEQWKDSFCVTRPRMVRGVWTDKVVGMKNVEKLKAILDQVMLARRLEDVGLDVPALDFQVLRLDAKDSSGQYLGLDRHATAAVMVGALEDIANDPQVARMRRRLGELKVAPVAEMLTSQLADSADKVVVFAHHRTVLSALRELFKNFGVAYIDGDVGQPARDAEIDRFRTDPRCRVFLGQNIACSTGMDGLQHVARRAVIVEPDWSGDVNYQLGKRVARMGSIEQDRCIVQMVALAGTLDEAIVGQNARETRMVAEIGLR